MPTTHKPMPMHSALVIDDDIFSQAIFRKNLEQMGIADVVMAGNGREAARALDAMPTPPDFLICDIFMPDMDGIEFISALGDRNFGGALVLVTGGDLSMMQMASQLAESGYGLTVLAAIPKPLLPQTLAAALGLTPPQAGPQ